MSIFFRVPELFYFWGTPPFLFLKIHFLFLVILNTFWIKYRSSAPCYHIFRAFLFFLFLADKMTSTGFFLPLFFFFSSHPFFLYFFMTISSPTSEAINSFPPTNTSTENVRKTTFFLAFTVPFSLIYSCYTSSYYQKADTNNINSIRHMVKVFLVDSSVL